jgi:hypothetical protein
MTNVLRYRLTAHDAGDIPYDGSAKDYALALEKYEAKLAALKATGAEILVEDARPVNVRAKTINEAATDKTAAIPAFLKK